MTTPVAVWIDHHEARVVHFMPGQTAEVATTAARAYHRPAGTVGPAPDLEGARRYYHDLARALDGFGSVLIVGPSTAKLDFIRYVHAHDRALEARIVGVETVDHPTDGQLVAYARKYFELGVNA
ncbi:MAG: translational machinery protein [Deltaproteobacteria bacterium]|nr:translational machinery protein [Deltaproteobacteria bacterium]